MKKFNENSQATFKQGETPREELQLPPLYFVTMDNWIKVIGEKAFIAWLKMFTWTDRKGAKNNPQLWNESKIPNSLNNVMKDLGVGKDTFYNKILKPLWNVGLIDLEEYEESSVKGNKPMNIIVYKYPQNKFELAVKPLEIVRNYDKDYSSSARTSLNDEQIEQIEGLFDEKLAGSETEPGVVPNENQGWFQDRTRDGSETEHNNIFNPITNTLNTENNNQNTINTNLNPNLKEENIYDVLQGTQIPSRLKIRIKILLQNQSINLSPEQILLIEDAYLYQIRKSYVFPHCAADDITALNDYEFSATVEKMLKTVKKIDNIRGLIKSWVQTAHDYKCGEQYGSNFAANKIDPNLPFYDWLKD